MSPDSNMPPEEDKPQTAEDLRPAEPAVDTNPSLNPVVMDLDKEPATGPTTEPSVVTDSNETEAPVETAPAGGGDEPATPAPSTVDQSPTLASFASPAQNFPDGSTNTVADTGKPPKKSKKLLVGGIIAAGMAVLLGGGAAAYSVWYQNPQKVVTDAIVNMFKAKSVALDGTVEIKNLGDDSTSFEKVVLTFDSQSTRATGEMNAKLVVEMSDGKDFTLEGSALVDGDANLYFKVKNVQSVLDEYMGLGGETESYVKTIVDKIDDKWVRIATDDYKDISEEASKTQECVTDVFKKYETDNKLQAQVGDAYRNNQFIVIDEELGSRDGSLGYVIDGDTEKAKSFLRELQDTDVYKELQKCDDSFEFNVDDFTEPEEADDTNERVEVWVSRFGHELTQLRAAFSDDDVSADFVMNTKFNQDVSVEAPVDYISFKDLIEDIQKAVMEQAMSQYDIDQEELDAMMMQYEQEVSSPVET